MIKQITGYRLGTKRVIFSRNYLKIFCLRIFVLSLAACGLWFVAENCFAQEQEHPLSYYEVIEKRNFFRPKEEISPKNKQNKINNERARKQNASLGLILTGIVKIRGKLKAIIEKSSGEGFYVGKNESVEDYLVKEIRTGAVTLEKDNEEFVLKLKKANHNTNAGSRNENKKEPSRKKINPSAAKTGYKPNILKELRTGKNPVQTLGGKE